MMRGFIFDQTRCVGCNACAAACILENGWNYFPREVYHSESFTSGAVSLINLSMACNHCENPSCGSGCPSGAFYRDEATGAIILHNQKCLGCNYCRWNCPYNAPKNDPVSGLTVKCNLCIDLLKTGRNPACSTACPTGALGFDKIEDRGKGIFPAWFPGQKLEPNIRFSEHETRPVEIIPERTFNDTDEKSGQGGKNITSEWSLIGFTFLTTISVGLLLSSLITFILPAIWLFISLIVLSGIISLFHLGKKMRAWKAVLNFRHSPLSREIICWIAYGALSVPAVITGNIILIIASSLTGLILLLIIDSVYTNSDYRLSFVLNSGQTFMTGLLIASFFAGAKEPFLFLAFVKIVAGVYRITKEKVTSVIVGPGILRLILLITTCIFMVKGLKDTDKAIIYFFIAGELIDRILYYNDFEPVNITSRFKSNNITI